jgi:outer membrane protein TolC
MKMIVPFLLSFVAITLQAQSLEEYLAQAADSNKALKASFLAYHAALEQTNQVGLLPDPEVSFGYFVSPVETRVGAQDARLSLMQMFPWLGTLGARSNVATEIAKAHYAAFRQARNDLLFNVKKTYYDLYENKQQIRVIKATLDILHTYESLATTRFESGQASLVDVLRIQMEIRELQNRLQYSQDKRAPLIAKFNGYLNRADDQYVAIPDTLEIAEILLEKSMVADSVLLGNDRLEVLMHRQQAASHKITEARKSGYPSFGIGLSYILVNERPGVTVPDNGKDAIMPMISLRLPIYRGRYQARVKENTLMFERLGALQIDQQLSLLTELELIWVDSQDAERRIELFREQTLTAEKAKRILLEAYGADGKDFEEVLRVQRMMLQFELNIIQAIKDKNIAVARIEKLM